MIELVSIYAAASAEGTFSFFATVHIDGRQTDVPVAVAALQSYGVFQYTLLVKTGQMYLHMSAEGRTPEAADAYWRGFVAIKLEQAAQAGQPPLPPPMN